MAVIPAALSNLTKRRHRTPPAAVHDACRNPLRVAVNGDVGGGQRVQCFAHRRPTAVSARRSRRSAARRSVAAAAAGGRRLRCVERPESANSSNCSRPSPLVSYSREARTLSVSWRPSPSTVRNEPSHAQSRRDRRGQMPRARALGLGRVKGVRRSDMPDALHAWSRWWRNRYLGRRQTQGRCHALRATCPRLRGV